MVSVPNYNLHGRDTPNSLVILEQLFGVQLIISLKILFHRHFYLLSETDKSYNQPQDILL